MGGFATSKMANLIDYLRDPATDLSAPIRKAFPSSNKPFTLYQFETDFERDIVQRYLLTF